MKTLAQYQAAVDEIREVCRRHGIAIEAGQDGSDSWIVLSEPRVMPEFELSCMRINDVCEGFYGHGVLDYIGIVPKGNER